MVEQHALRFGLAVAVGVAQQDRCGCVGPSPAARRARSRQTKSKNGFLSRSIGSFASLSASTTRMSPFGSGIDVARVHQPGGHRLDVESPAAPSASRRLSSRPRFGDVGPRQTSTVGRLRKDRIGRRPAARDRSFAGCRTRRGRGTRPAKSPGARVIARPPPPAGRASRRSGSRGPTIESVSPEARDRRPAVAFMDEDAEQLDQERRVEQQQMPPSPR